MNLKARMQRLKGDRTPEKDPNTTVTQIPVPAPDPVESRSWELPPEQRRWKERLYKRLLEIMDLSLIGTLEEKEARRQIRDILHAQMEEMQAPLNVEARQRVVERIEDEILGLGPLEPLLADPSISDILVNGPRNIYVERRGKLQRTDIHFDDAQHLLKIIDRIVSNVGRRIDESSPMVDARLADGSRVNAIIPPLAIDGPSMSIRRFGVETLEIEDLVHLGSLSPLMADLLKQVVRAELNILVSGGTGSGKTTLLNILSGFIPADERIVTIEDSAELQLRQPHVVRLETRPPNIEGRGEVGQRDLVRNSLRMRPDRIVVGEVRGAEALDMLQAMNTGHDGSLTTIHANSPRDALARIENMVAMTGFDLPVRSLRAQMASAIDLVVQTERQEDGRRRLVSIQEINGMEGDVITMSEIMCFERQGIAEDGSVLGAYRATGIMPKFRERLERRGLLLDPVLFDPHHRHVAVVAS